MWPHRWQPTRLLRPWDSPGKNTWVGFHFLLQCMKVKSESEVSQSCQTLSDAMNCSSLGSFIHGIFQARVLEWGQLSFYIIFSQDPHSTFNINYASTIRVAARYLTLFLSENLYLSKCIFNTCVNLIHIFCSFSHFQLFASPWTSACQASLSFLSPGVCSNSCSLSWWCYPTISSSVSLSPPAHNLSQHQGLFQWGGSLHQVAKDLDVHLQHQSFQWIFMVDFL